MSPRLRRGLAAALVVGVAVAGLTQAPASSYAADSTTSATTTPVAADRPPVARPDRIVAFEGDDLSPNVVANDTDPDGDTVTVCRAGTPSLRSARVEVDDITEYSASGSSGSSQTREHLSVTGELYVGVPRSTRPTTFTVPFQVCDDSYLVATTLTVRVIHVPDVRITRAFGHPGFVRVHNPSGRRATVSLNAPFTSRSPWFGEVAMRPHSARDVRVDSRTVQWEAYTPGASGHFMGSGTVRGVVVPRGWRPMSEPVEMSSATVGRASGDATGPRPTAPSTTSTSVGPLARRFLAEHTTPRATTRSATRRTPAAAYRATTSARTGSARWPSDTWDPSYDVTTAPAPVTAPDTAKAWVGIDLIDVLANDDDPAGGPLDICKVAPAGEGMLGSGDGGGPNELAVTPDTAGTHTMTYYACSAHRLTPETVTVHATRPARVTVLTSPRHPSRVRVTNPNAVAVTFEDGDLLREGPRRIVHVRVPAGTTRWVPVHHRWALWFAFVTTPKHDVGFAGSGSLKKVTLSRKDAAADRSTRDDVSGLLLGL